MLINNGVHGTNDVFVVENILSIYARRAVVQPITVPVPSMMTTNWVFRSVLLFVPSTLKAWEVPLM